MAKRVLITGGTGLIGQALIEPLRKAGYEVLILSRRAGNHPQATILPWNGRQVPADLQPEDIKAVINLAGAGIADHRWTPAYKQVLWESRIRPTEAVVRWLHEKAPHARLLSASAIGYYGHSLSQERLSEASPPGKDFLAGLAQAWEKAASTAPAPSVIFRIGVVLSPKGGAWPKLRQGFRLGVGTYFLPGKQGFSWVHIADVVGAFLWALQNATAAGIYNLTAPDPVSSHTFSETVGRLLNCKFLLPLPELPLRIALGELTTTLTQGLYVLPHRLLEEGFVFQYARLADTLYALLAAKS